jgi:hypothetical protein
METNQINEPTEEPTQVILRSGAPAHQITQEDRIKGGRAKSPAKTLAATLNPKRFCHDKCALWDKCWAKVIISSTPTTAEGLAVKNKLWDADRKKWKCALKAYGEQMTASTVNIYLKGEAGLQDTIRGILVEVMLKTRNEKDYRATIASANTLMRACEVFYGSKNKTEISMKKDVTQEFIDMVKDLNKNSEEKKLE